MDLRNVRNEIKISAFWRSIRSGKEVDEATAQQNQEDMEKAVTKAVRVSYALVNATSKHLRELGVHDVTNTTLASCSETDGQA